MGAGFSFNVKCPTPFVSTDALSCVMPCPTDRKFVRQGMNGAYKCVYSPDPQIAVDLVTVGSVPFDGTTLEQLQSVNSQKYTEFATEKTRFENAITVVYGNIDKQKKIEDAFKDLQAAENVRDQSPSAYQAARTAYYTLVKGPEWINEERTRIGAAEVAPEVQKYRQAVDAVNIRTQEQQKTIDVVNGIKDKVLSLKDDFKYSVNTFSDQMEKVKIQLNMTNRSREQEKDTTWDWVNLILNVLLVAVLVYAVYTFVRRYFISRPPAIPVTTIRIPTYTGQPL
jgi:hypothetical protein